MHAVQVATSHAENAVVVAVSHAAVAQTLKMLEEKGEDILLRFEVEDTGIGIDPKQLSEEPGRNFFFLNDGGAKA